MDEQPVSIVMVRIADLANILGVSNIRNLSGCWEYQLSDDWWFAVNGHNESVKTSTGSDLLPYNCLVEYKGLPAGYFSPFEGVFVFGKEDDFINAIDMKIKVASH